MGGRDTIVGAAGWLPVDGLHAIFELGRGPELPLPDDSPDDGDTADARCNDNKDGKCSFFGGRRGACGSWGSGGRLSLSSGGLRDGLGIFGCTGD